MPVREEMTPNKLTSMSRSQTAIRNFSNPNYHASLDLAQAYCGYLSQHLSKVQSHLHAAQFDNYALTSAERTYRKQIVERTQKNFNEFEIKRAKSSASIRSRARSQSKRKVVKIEDNQVVSNPEDGSISKMQPEDKSAEQTQSKLMKQILSCKTSRIPQYADGLGQAWSYKKMLENQISKLKYLINSEKKKKTKISLNCNKIMNEREQVYKNYKNIEEQNYHISTNIAAICRENQFLNSEINQLNNKNSLTHQDVIDQKKEVDTLRKYVQKTRLVVLEEEKDIAKLKAMLTASYNNMSNNFINMNLLKSEKALLLSDIDNSHAKNK